MALDSYGVLTVCRPVTEAEKSTFQEVMDLYDTTTVVNAPLLKKTRDCAMATMDVILKAATVDEAIQKCNHLKNVSLS